MTEYTWLPLAKSLINARGWDESTRAIMLAGKGLQVLPVDARTEQHRIDGCESPVWLLSDADGRFYAYSDSKILRGVLAILLEQGNTLTAAERHSFDFAHFLRECGLMRYLSQSRNNGIRHVIDYLRSH